MPRLAGELAVSVMMKLSVIIICWNDLRCILDCIESVCAETSAEDYEIIVADNGSSDGSATSIRARFPAVRIVENGENRGFGKGNNAGIRVAQGEYVLILNPDTIIRDRALERMIDYADRHPEAGAFGCRVLNLDGSLQNAAHPLPTIGNSLVGALGLWWLFCWAGGRLSDRYLGEDGRTERQIGFQAGCCLLVRSGLLKALGGFDERFFHQFEDADLCRRVWETGHQVLFCPEAEITHIAGQNRGTYPPKVVLEAERSKYRYFDKYYGAKGALCNRYISLLAMGVRYAGFTLANTLKRDAAREKRLNLYQILLRWHWLLDPVRFLENGEEPDVGYPPLAPRQGGCRSLQKVCRV